MQFELAVKVRQEFDKFDMSADDEQQAVVAAFEQLRQLPLERMLKIVVTPKAEE